MEVSAYVKIEGNEYVEGNAMKFMCYGDIDYLENG
jgi:hypothetical protein